MRQNYPPSRTLLVSIAALLTAPIAFGLAAPSSDAPSGVKDTNGVIAPGVSTGPDAVDRSVAAAAQASTAVLAAPKLSGYELLLRGRYASSRIYHQLSSVVCRERIDRFKGTVSDVEGRALDVITSDVSMEDGGEHYSNVKQNNKPRASISHIGGPWSEGEYSTFLRQTAEVLDSDSVIKLGVITRVGKTKAILFPYDVPPSESTWDFQVRSKHYMLGFHGEVWISQATGEVLRIRRIANQIPDGVGISRVEWSVDFGPNDLDGHSFFLPSTATYSVTYTHDQHREWNVISFSDYHHYGVDIAIHYN